VELRAEWQGRSGLDARSYALVKLAALIALDAPPASYLFRWAVQLSSHLAASRMLVTEKVFGFLLAALGVQLILNGLADVGVIHLTSH
jgi:small neutral amino acid transporter SnatA (MarC family)